PYIAKWARVIRFCPGTTFYCYTRSANLPGLRAAIEQHLAPLPNLRLWYSADSTVPFPTDLPPGVRVAWLQLRHDEPVPAGADLVFRTHPLRKQASKRIGLTLVCPNEQGLPGDRPTCASCGVCWR